LSEGTKEFIKGAKVIVPERTSTKPKGYRYPVAEEYFGEDAESRLNELVEQGLMEREFYQRELGCPKCGSINLIVRFYCPKCGSTHIVKDEVIEHWPCGYVGPESEFKDGKCPKCGKPLKKIGVDYSKPGPMFKCMECGEVLQNPVDKLNCANCGEIFDKGDAKEVILYAYRITPRLEEELDVALAQRSYLIENLTKMGFNIENPENIYGRSGVKHYFYMVASRGTGILKLRIVIEILSAYKEVPVDEVFSLYAKALDIGAYGLIIAAIPKFSEDSKKMMDYYNIAYVEVPSLDSAAEKIIKKLKELMETPTRPLHGTQQLGWSLKK